MDKKWLIIFLFIIKIIFDSYGKNVITTLTKNNIDDLNIELSDGSIYELEAKFTSYNYEKKKYVSGVPHVHYLRLIEILDKDINYDKKIEKSDVILYENDIRKITIDQVANQKVSNQKVIYEQKTHIENIDLKNYNVRISLNNEKLTEIKNSLPRGITRGRVRRSYVSKFLPIRVDITEITEEIDIIELGVTKKKINIKYEVEIEYHGLKSEIKTFFDIIYIFV